MSEPGNLQRRREVSAIRSPLAWALLGVVIESPGHGYELAHRFRRVYGDTLALSYHKNVYRLLETLHVHELIEETEPGPDEKPARNRQPKPHYRATAHGRRAYEEWLLSQIEEERQRQRIFTRQLAMLEPQAALEVIERYEEECLAEANDPAVAESERDSVAFRLADQDEQLALEARLSWIRYARRELNALVEQGGQGGQRG